MSDIIHLRDQEPWMDDGLCHKVATPPDDWFPVSAEGKRLREVASRAEVVAVCYQCPVHVECLEFADRTKQGWGIWGGLTPDQRLRRRRALEGQA